MKPVVNSVEPALFDVLRNQPGPYVGFGDPLPESPVRIRRFYDAMQDARIRVADGFRCDLADARLVPMRLDEIIRQMWATGWCPKRNNVALFTCDFGLVLTAALLAALGGTLVLRSEREASHLSLWWPSHRIEAFPFHHILKCLSESDGESIAYFFGGLSALVGVGAGKSA